MNKKGFMRMVEATIAIMLILGVLIVLASQKRSQQPESLDEKLPVLLDEVANNFSLREEILSETDENVIETKLENNFKNKINPAFDYSVEVCKLDSEVDSCFLTPYPNVDSDIFSSERVISSSINKISFEPMKIKLFMWKR